MSRWMKLIFQLSSSSKLVRVSVRNVNKWCGNNKLENFNNNCVVEIQSLQLGEQCWNRSPICLKWSRLKSTNGKADYSNVANGVYMRIASGCDGD